MGYFYTAGTLLENLVDTIWMFVGLVVLAGLAQRWLFVAQGKLEYEEAIQRHEARQEAKQESKRRDANETAHDGETAEVQVDVKALSDTSRELINTAVILSGLIGLWAIWSEVLPALRVWEEVTLWQLRLVDEKSGE
jgi:potassium efflux system protein